ncbi:MAG: enoyl-CoA hydratase-related protein [Thermomicrobiales bacterium]
MTPYANFELAIDGPKALLTFTREERLNALDADTFASLREALARLHADRSVRIVIMTGRGRAFVAGADITGYVDRTVEEYVAFQRLGRSVYDGMTGLRQPIIAAVNGFALGGGFELVLAADLVVAAEHATFGLPEVKLGLLPGGGGTQRLPRLIGANRAKELLMTANFLTAEEARELGIVNRVVPAERLLDEAHALADRILTRAPLAVEMAKQLVADGLDAPLATAITMETGMTATLYDTEDAREGISAFIEKRPAAFTGR